MKSYHFFFQNILFLKEKLQPYSFIASPLLSVYRVSQKKVYT